MRYSDIEAGARAAAASALAHGPEAAARAAIAAAEDFLAKAGRALSLPLDKLACKAGCAWCCHQMVGVTQPELALIRAALSDLDPAVRERVAARSRDLAEKARGFGPAQWWAAHLPCPLLEDGLCLVHEARPLPCRAMNSADAKPCERSFAGEQVPIPALAAQHGILGHAQAGLAQAARSGVTVLGVALRS